VRIVCHLPRPQTSDARVTLAPGPARLDSASIEDLDNPYHQHGMEHLKLDH